MLTRELAGVLARVALANVKREFPRRLDQLVLRPDTEWRPRALHPAFYGSYDWHSAVHMHWVLARVLRLFPDLETVIAPALSEHFEMQNLATELAFFRAPGGNTFERPYGWAWLLKLQAELLRVRRWHEAVEPLALELAARMQAYLRASPYPVRAGTHGNTAFACLLALDYAELGADAGLHKAIGDAAMRWYLEDRDYPVAYEPSADDFLSGALVEAALMQALLPGPEFSAWMANFFPRDFGPLGHPPKVTDHADPKQSHLDGLCLSRAWCFRELGFADLAEQHLKAGMPHVLGGDYAGEHWLASFAVLALTAEARRIP